MTLRTDAGNLPAHPEKLRDAAGIVFAGLAFCVFATPALAAEAQSDAPTVVEEVIVTISKRETDVQDLPATVAAFSASQIEDLGIDNLSELSSLMPNVRVKQEGNASISIRGISQSFQSQSPVALHTNGAFRTSADLLYGEYYDLKAIEVLRGPAGVSYGRNATAGAVNLTWKPPIDEWGFAGDATLGNYGHEAFRGVANIPIAGEGDRRLMGRVSVQSEQHNGYVQNLLEPKKRGFGAEDWYAIRGALRSEIGEDFSLDLHAKYLSRSNFSLGGPVLNTTTAGYPVGKLVIAGTRDVLPFDAYNGLQAFRAALPSSNLAWITGDNPALGGNGNFRPDPGEGDVGAAVIGSFLSPASLLPALPPTGDLRAIRSRVFQQGVKPFQHIYTLDGQAQLRLHDVPLLGEVDVTLVGGVDRQRANRIIDVDGAEIPGFDGLGQDYKTNSSSGELRFSSAESERVEWLVGAFGFKQRDREFSPGLTPFGLLGTDYDKRNKGYAVFGNVSVEAIDTVHLFGGLRYNRDQARAISTPLKSVFTPSPVKTDIEQSFSEVTGEAGIRWYATPDHMFYGKFAHGYKAGGVNVTSGGAPNTFGPEKIDAFEVGSRNTFYDRKVQVNLTAFHYDYSALQVPFTQGTEIITRNAAAAKVYGAELEVLLYPTPAWRLQGNVGYLHAVFQNFCADDPLNYGTVSDAGCPANALAGLGLPNGQSNLDGKRLEDSPPWSLGLVSSYRWTLPAGGTLTGIVESTWTDSYYRSPFNRPIDKVGSYTKTDLRLVWSDPKDRYSIEGYVENLENETIFASAFAVELIGSYAGVSMLSPRTVGLRASMRLGGER